MLLHSCSAAATTANHGRRAEDEDTRENSDKGYSICQPEKHRIQGRKGRPRACETLTGYKDFHDGGGLCSPVRWRKQVRELADGANANWYWLRREPKRAILDFIGSEKELEMEAFRMASGGDANWRVARDEGLQQILLGILCKWLEAQVWGRRTWTGSPTTTPSTESARSRGRP